MIKLLRVCQNAFGTFGVLIYDGRVLCATLERKWLDNQKSISCVPSGLYDCARYGSDKHPNVWELLNVLNREKILIHTGNTMADTEGCILVGKYFTSDGVAESVAAMNDLRRLLPKSFQLEIIDCKV